MSIGLRQRGFGILSLLLLWPQYLRLAFGCRGLWLRRGGGKQTARRTGRELAAGLILGGLGGALVAISCLAAEANPYFGIQLVDQATGRGIPLVELETVHHLRLVSDSQGWIAFHEPGLMHQDVYFHIKSHGYEMPADGFGFRGRTLRTVPGGTAQIALRRVNLAERLYRITGAGIYRDSLLLGRPVPLEQSVLNAQVLGSDSVLSTLFNGRIYWFWGDTNRTNYPLGSFQVTGATSRLVADGGLRPEQGIDLTYFTTSQGFMKPVCPMPGAGPTWIDSLFTVADEQGQPLLVASYVKVKPPLTVYRRGLARWDEAAQEFRPAGELPVEAPALPTGHALRRTVAGQEYLYFGHSYPLVRVKATWPSVCDLSQYQTFSPYAEATNPQLGSSPPDKASPSGPNWDRLPDGRLRYGWKSGTPGWNQAEQDRLIKSRALPADDGWLYLRDRDSGAQVAAHAGCVAFQPARQRWALIVSQHFGSSLLGEIWYAEADQPEGPWSYGVKVVTHDRYSFYNPKIHTEWHDQAGQYLYFEGTYTAEFSGNPLRTARYDYNQIMYRLDLSDPRLALPVPIYYSSKAKPVATDAQDHGTGAAATAGTGRRPGLFAIAAADIQGRALPDQPPCWDRIAWLAPDRPGVGLRPVVRSNKDGGSRLELLPEPAVEEVAPRVAVAVEQQPLFYALPPEMPERPATVVPLWVFRQVKGGRLLYHLDGTWQQAGYERLPQPLCYVWPLPRQARLARDVAE